MTAITYTVADESRIARNPLRKTDAAVPCFRVYRSPSSVAGQSTCMATFESREEADAHKITLEADTAGLSYEDLMQELADNEG